MSADAMTATEARSIALVPISVNSDSDALVIRIDKNKIELLKGVHGNISAQCVENTRDSGQMRKQSITF